MADIQHIAFAPKGFRRIDGFGGMYFIDEHSQVWSAYTCCLLKQRIHKSGYWTVSLLNDQRKQIPRLVHQLTARTWLGLPNGEIGLKRGQFVVNHKDGDKLNNHVSNLEWITTEDNLKHYWNLKKNNN